MRVPDLNKRQFIQGRTNVRPEGHYADERPGTQGQMVTGGHAHPWPRGFTPERRNEVSEVMPGVSPGSYGEIMMNPGQKQAVQNRTRDMVARTSVPASDMEGLSEIRWDLSPSSDAAGSYGPDRSRKDLRSETGRLPGRIRMNPGRGSLVPDFDDAQEQTFAHEAGHHRSMYHEGNPLPVASRRDLPKVLGAEEARADQYGRSHYQGKSEYQTPYPSESYFDPSTPEHKQFGTAYRSEQRNLNPQQMPREGAPTIPMVNVEGSEPLYRNPNTGEWEIEDYKRRRGK